MELIGQLANPSGPLERVLALPPIAGTVHFKPKPTIRGRRPNDLRKVVVNELATETSGLRLMEIRRRVEVQLDEPVAIDRFRDYVNYHSRGPNAFLERLGYGMYRLRS